MAAGKLCCRGNKQETVEKWKGLFMSLKTQQESLVFVKRMMAVAVSSITYLRGIFPEDAYNSRYMEDTCVKILREDCSLPSACKVVKWLMGCFDALDKQYLQIVFMGVHTNPDEPNNIIESYQFRFKYTEKGPVMGMLRNNDVQVQTAQDDTKKASVVLIRKLFLLLQNLDAFAQNVYLSMKLYYYDDITPEEYQPPGFKEGECDSLWFQGQVVHFRVGEVNSPFHSLVLRVSADQRCVERLQEDQLTESTQVSRCNPPDREKIKLPPTKKYKDDDLPSEDESAQFKKPRKPKAKRLGAARNLVGKKRRT